jgi:hypothetical protein
MRPALFGVGSVTALSKRRCSSAGIHGSVDGLVKEPNGATTIHRTLSTSDSPMTARPDGAVAGVTLSAVGFQRGQHARGCTAALNRSPVLAGGAFESGKFLKRRLGLDGAVFCPSLGSRATSGRRSLLVDER